jgi:hemoglobin/transferrin/lactoferrin receptor protein
VANVDDLTKVFDTRIGLVTVPNPDVKPERTWNTELGISKSFGQWLGIEGTVYYTAFTNAIVLDKFRFNGQDSILYDGVKSEVIAPQNKGKATIWGTSVSLKGRITEGVTFYGTYNFTKGTVAATEKNASTPLDHVPPAFGRMGITYAKNSLNAEVFSSFSAWKRIKDYRIGTEDNEAYATKDGMPSWWTLNLRVGKDVWRGLKIQAGIDNILDTQYRVFASGIHASGRNFWGTLRYNW